jgi:hypothetical protein
VKRRYNDNKSFKSQDKRDDYQYPEKQKLPYEIESNQLGYNQPKQGLKPNSKRIFSG